LKLVEALPAESEVDPDGTHKFKLYGLLLINNEFADDYIYKNIKPSLAGG